MKKVLPFCAYLCIISNISLAVTDCPNNVIGNFGSGAVRWDSASNSYVIDCHFCELGKYPAGKNNCADCPNIGMNIGGRMAGILGCAQVAGMQIEDNTGTYEFISNCAYSVELELASVCQQMGRTYDPVDGCSGGCKLMAANEIDGFEQDYIHWFGNDFVSVCNIARIDYEMGSVYSNGKCYACWGGVQSMNTYRQYDPTDSMVFNWYPVHR